MVNRLKAKTTEQIGELRKLVPRGLDKLEEGQEYCPVCDFPATVRKSEPGLYDHPFRLFPCRSFYVGVIL